MDTSAQPTYSSLTSNPPDWLLPKAVEEWNRLAPELEQQGFLTEADLQTFALYCQAVARHQEIEEAIGKSGTLVLAIATGLLNAERKIVQEIRGLAGLFGFNPTDRSRVKVSKQKPKDPFTEFQKRRAEIHLLKTAKKK